MVAELIKYYFPSWVNFFERDEQTCRFHSTVFSFLRRSTNRSTCTTTLQPAAHNRNSSIGVYWIGKSDQARRKTKHSDCSPFLLQTTRREKKNDRTRKQSTGNLFFVFRKIFSRFSLNVPDNVLRGICLGRVGLIEVFLYNLRTKIDEWVQSGIKRADKRSSPTNTTPIDESSF